MIFYKSKGQQKEKLKGNKNPFEQSEVNEVPDSFESTGEEEKRILEEMLDKKRK